MRVGVAYYPEHWEPSRWERDVAQMADAGIRVVRMGEFAWSRMEPEEGRFEFGFLDTVLGMMESAGIACVLGTPTASPPAWLHAKYPEIYPADKRGYRLGFGTRQQRCLNNPDMRRHSRLIVDAMASQFGNHSAVIGWQTDNEFGGNLCYCPVCQARFHEWLRGRYESLDALNRAWGTVFWSHEYSEWQQIPLPWEVKCGDAHNPSLQLDFRRFQSEATVRFQQEQIDILRAKSPERFVTHNLMGLHGSMDYYDLARNLDFVCWDNYPSTPWFVNDMGPDMTADAMRGIKQSNPWVMEQQNGITGWERMGRRPSDAQLRCWAWQTIAHGADAVVFFRWRSCLYGAEQFWHGALNHDGKPRRRYWALSDFAREVNSLSVTLDGTGVRSEVAILNSYEQHYAFQIQPQAEGLDIWRQVSRYYRALRQQGLNVDIVPLSVDLAQYRLVILPGWHIISSAEADRFKSYVRQGGTLIVGARTGVKNTENVCRTEPLPAFLSELVGLEVDDYDPLGSAEIKVETAKGRLYRVTCWADALSLKGAESIAVYTEAPFQGETALAKNRFGAGTAYYFGAFGEPAFYEDLLTSILDESGVQRVVNAPAEVDVSWRERDGVKVLFLLNLASEERTVRVSEQVFRLLGAPCEGGRITLPGFGVGIYQWLGSEEDLENEMEPSTYEHV
ncbi:MAG: beta-galactosidase [Candidatus Hydrogenedentes bacterium]|nr:beta-galactosidase [Candidatus Hydrogenedentota bacterium]